MGNSRIKLFVADRRRILHSAIYRDLPDLRKLFDLFPRIGAGIYVASGKVPADMLDFLTRRLNPFIHFTALTPCPMKIVYETPETLGGDRLAAVIGANAFFPNANLAAFDFGTAITINFVDQNNRFTGGNISPGLSMRFKALHDYTNRLPLLGAPENVGETGQSTQSAIEAGVVNGIIGEITSYILKYPDRKIIFTGGDAFYFARKIKYPIFAFSNPIVFGLNKVLISNIGKCVI
jgi:type III pantothenate kinase